MSSQGPLGPGDLDGVPIEELSEEERVALPPEFHRPFFDGLGVPHSWICEVCWGDGWQTSWPCAPATAGGLKVAEAAGLGSVA